MGNNVCSVCVSRDAPDTARKVEEKPVEARGEVAEEEEKHSPLQNKTDDKSSQEQLKADERCSQQLKPEHEQKIQKDQTSNWAIHAGAVTINKNGVEVKPQMKFGAELDNFNAEVGLGDVRDGIKIGAVAQAMVDARAEGNSVRNLHENIKCDTVGFKEALEVAKGIFSSGKDKASELSKIAEALGMDLASLEKSFGQSRRDSANDESKSHGADTADKADQDRLQLRVEGSIGVGVSAEVRLGWADTQGYKMIGCGGKAAAGVGVGADVFAGKHESGTSAMLIFGIGNFLFEYTLPLESALEDTEASEKTEMTANRGVFEPSKLQKENKSATLQAATSCPVPQSKDAEKLEKRDEVALAETKSATLQAATSCPVPQSKDAEKLEKRHEVALEETKSGDPEMGGGGVTEPQSKGNGLTKSVVSPASQPTPKLSKKAKQKARRERAK